MIKSDKLVYSHPTGFLSLPSGWFFDVTLQDFYLKEDGKITHFQGKVFSPIEIFDSNYHGKDFFPNDTIKTIIVKKTLEI